jgi:hypothetical protein
MADALNWFFECAPAAVFVATVVFLCVSKQKNT